MDDVFENQVSVSQMLQQASPVFCGSTDHDRA